MSSPSTDGNHNSTSHTLEMSGIRNNLIETAVQFLNMDKIRTQPEEIKRDFLKKKGLSHLEIEEAFRQSKPLMIMGDGVLRNANNYIEVPPPNLLPMTPSNSIWSRIKYGTQVVLFITGVGFGIHYLYKQYIGPLLTGQYPITKEESLLEVQKSVMEVLQQIEATLERINQNILNHNSHNLGNSTMEELKAEMKTIKALLVNKRTFPASPCLSPSIPEWQRTSKSQSNQAENSLEKFSANSSFEVTQLKDEREGNVNEQEPLVDEEKTLMLNGSSS